MADEELRRIFAMNLNNYLALNGYKQADLARHMGVSTATTAKWCTGQTMPRIDKIQFWGLDQRLAKVLSVRLQEVDDERRLQDGEPLLNGRGRNADAACDAVHGKHLAAIGGANLDELFEHGQVAVVDLALHVQVEVGVHITIEPIVGREKLCGIVQRRVKSFENGFVNIATQ